MNVIIWFMYRTFVTNINSKSILILVTNHIYHWFFIFRTKTK